MNFTLAREFYAAILKLIRREVKVQTIAMTVVSVDYSKGFCACKEEDGETFENVRLKAAIDDTSLGMLVYPKQGTQVLVSKVMNDENNLYVSKINEIDSIKIEIKDKFKLQVDSDGNTVLNDGDNGSMVIIEKLNTNLDRLKTYADQIELAAGNIATALDALVPGTSVAYNAITEPAKAACEFTDMGNDKIKH